MGVTGKIVILKEIAPGWAWYLLFLESYIQFSELSGIITQRGSHLNL